MNLDSFPPPSRPAIPASPIVLIPSQPARRVRTPAHLYPVRLDFTRHFDRGILAGLTVPDSVSFVSQHSARRWLRGVRANSRTGKLDYKVGSFCMVLV